MPTDIPPAYTPKNSIYTGQVYHARHKPFHHDYRYKVFTLFVDIDDLERLDKSLKLFSLNNWNIFSLFYKDHGRRDGSDIRAWVEEAGRTKGIDLTNARIFLLAFPRLFGYVFNPISIFYCYDTDDKLTAVLYEVKNTFGEQHGYFLPVEDSKTNKIRHSARKIFHVSPFIHMNCEYHFRLAPPSETLQIGIHQFDGEGKILTAFWTGKRHPLTDGAILKTVLKSPFMTIKVIAAIHWQAFRLWLKGAKYIKKPPEPETDFS